MKIHRRNRYGLEPVRSVREVAALMNISHTRVMQLEASALRKLRTGLGVALDSEPEWLAHPGARRSA